MASSGASSAPVVIDLGTGSVKCGFAGDNFPAAVFPSMVGRPLLRSSFSGSSSSTSPTGATSPTGGSVAVRDVMVGEECAAQRHCLEISYPIRGGVVKDWPGVELLLDHTFACLGLPDPRSARVLLCEPPGNPKPA
eukprot:RCo014270